MAEDKRATVKFVTATGREHEFEMGMDKALTFSQQVSGHKQGSAKSWIDMWDFTGRANGQFLINMDSIESVLVEACQEAMAEPQLQEAVG
jgi:hypothetical protein